MKRFLLFLALAGCASEVPVEPAKDPVREPGGFPHELWTKVLQQRCAAGLVDYAAIKADPADLDAYLAHVAKDSPESNPAAFPGREDRLAYAINAYNAYVVKGVVDHYPCDSVKSIGALPFDFFRKFEYPFGGKRFSLEAWETKAREEFKEPRLHFVLSCASLGCPRLPAEAFGPGRLEEQLARETKAFVGEERNLSVGDGVVTLSSIFKWYRKDFFEWQEARGEPQSLLAWIRTAGRDVPANAELRYSDYDWSLNDRKAAK